MASVGTLARVSRGLLVCSAVSSPRAEVPLGLGTELPSEFFPLPAPVSPPCLLSPSARLVFSAAAHLPGGRRKPGLRHAPVPRRHPEVSGAGRGLGGLADLGVSGEELTRLDDTLGEEKEGGTSRVTVESLGLAVGRKAVLSLSRRCWGDSRAWRGLDSGSSEFAVPVRSPGGHVWETAGLAAGVGADVDEAVTAPMAFGGGTLAWPWRDREARG